MSKPGTWVTEASGHVRQTGPAPVHRSAYLAAGGVIGSDSPQGRQPVGERVSCPQNPEDWSPPDGETKSEPRTRAAWTVLCALRRRGG